MLHWTLDKQTGACNSHDETNHCIKNQEVDGIGNEVEVGTLGEDSQCKRTTKPHGNEAYVSHGHNVGQVQVCKGLSAASQAQKHRQAYRHFYVCRKVYALHVNRPVLVIIYVQQLYSTSMYKVVMPFVYLVASPF